MDELKPGDLLFLTQAYNDYLHQRNPQMAVIATNRLAKLEEIIDWKSPKGKLIKDLRIKSGKWKGLPLEENKYIVSVYYHDIAGRKGERGVVERGVSMFQFHPKNPKAAFFEKAPDWIYKEIMKQCEAFEVELKEPAHD
jgi:hypothetical protein